MAVNLINSNDTTVSQINDEIKIDFSSARNTQIEDLEDGVSELETSVDNLTPKVLWENSDTTTNFAAQTVTLSEPIENFRYYTAIFIHSTDNTFLVSGISKTGYGMRASTDGWAVINHRDITSISGTSCTFTDNKEYQTYGGSERVANQRLIPFQIIGQY